MNRRKAVAFAMTAGALALLSCTAGDPPAAPQLSGPDWTLVGDTVTLALVTTDPQGDNVSYRCRFEENMDGEWSPYVAFGTPLAVSHGWDSPGNREVRAQARDDWAAESDWSQPHEVHVLAEPGFPDRRIGSVDLSGFVVGMAVSPDGSRLYVHANGSEDSIVAVDTEQDRVVAGVETGDIEELIVSAGGERIIALADAWVYLLATDGLRLVDSIALPDLAWALAGHPDGDRFYLAGDNGMVYCGSIAARALVDSIPVASADADLSGLAVHPTGDRLYASVVEEATVVVVDAATKTVVERIPVAVYPEQLSVSPDGGRLYVCHDEGEFLSVVRTANNRVEAILYVEEPYAAVPYPSGDFLHVCSYGDVLVLSTEDFSVVDRSDGDDVAILPDGSKAYVDDDGELVVYGFQE